MLTNKNLRLSNKLKIYLGSNPRDADSGSNPKCALERTKKGGEMKTTRKGVSRLSSIFKAPECFRVVLELSFATSLVT